MIWRRALRSTGTLAFVLGVVLALNHTESCKLSDPPQCSAEGPSWAIIGLAFGVSLCAFAAAAILATADRRSTSRDATPIR
jgi:hypothetical protein